MFISFFSASASRTVTQLRIINFFICSCEERDDCGALHSGKCSLVLQLHVEKVAIYLAEQSF